MAKVYCHFLICVKLVFEIGTFTAVSTHEMAGGDDNLLNISPRVWGLMTRHGSHQSFPVRRTPSALARHSFDCDSALWA